MTNKGLFFDSATNLESACDLVVDKSALLIYLPEPNKSLHIWKIKSFAACEFNGAQLKIINGQHRSQHVICSGEIAKLIQKKWQEDEVIEPEGRHPLFAIRLILFLVISTTAFILLTYFYFLPYLANKAVQLIPIKTEIELGNALAEKIAKDYQCNDSATYYANAIIAKLKFDAAYPIKVKIIESKDLNAFALPGGQIFVYSAMLQKIDRLDAWVALIGHEQTHVKKQHSLKSISRTAVTSILIATIIGDVSGISTGILYQAQQFEQLQYSRELETEADDEGLLFMQRNQMDAEGMLRLLNILNNAGEKMPGVMKYLSTHPDTESRILNVKSQITKKQNYPQNAELEALFQKMKAFEGKH